MHAIVRALARAPHRFRFPEVSRRCLEWIRFDERRITMKKLMLGVLIACFSLASIAEVAVKDPWVRATVPHQQATGAFMQLTADQEARLVKAESPLAEAVEVHEMKMEHNVMKMRALPEFVLPAQKTVTLQPGGLHIMLTGLKRPVAAGELVPLTLVFEGRNHRRETLELKVPARSLSGGAPGRHGN